MKTKSIKYFLLAGVVGCGMTAGLTACSEWNDHYENTANGGGAGGTLWQQMKANPQLSDFCDVMEQTKVYRMHKKTPVSYADLLSSGQSFTVIAPVNGSFDKAALLERVQTASGDSAVEKSFAQNHISRSLVSSTTDATKMLMLNQKHLSMENGTVDGVTVITPNTRSSNGVLHVVEKALSYKHNLYELLCDEPGLSAIGDNLKRFNEDVFDPDLSVSNGMVDGVPVYVDSVVIERNRLLEAIGYLYAEDSTYMVVAPTAAGWDEAYNEVSKYFRYDESIDKRDSLQQYYTMRALMEDAVFNMTDQKNINDSLLSVPYINTVHTYEKGKPVYHVFRKPFAPGGVLYGAQPRECSNGIMYTTEKWPFDPTETFFKEIFVEGEETYLIQDYTKCSYNVRTAHGDTISNNKYLRVTPLKATDNWTMNFQVNGTLSGSYDVYAILLPKTVNDPNEPKLRPCKFKATINYLDEKGKAAKFDCQNEADGKSEFKSDPFRTDTVLLARGFHFPACNYGQSNSSVNIRIQCSITSSQNAQYSREMFLDCIYLRPRTSKSEEQ